MRTVVEPQQHIAALWSKPEIRDGETFRLMRYVMRFDYNDIGALYNIVTGQLVILDQSEKELLNTLPKQYSPAMEQLVDGYYLVKNHFDEHQRVIQTREVLRKTDEKRQKQGITSYTILPTTNCNAKCYYCFEQGVKPVTMSEQTADAVVDYIIRHCNKEKKISILWFGGEPTVAAHRIDQICDGLLKNNIQFHSDITTNGYLFDEEMTKKAKTLWQLHQANITLDGTENTYNRIKAYAHATDNPYRRVMNNIGQLLDYGVRVRVRMNFDLGNYREFTNLLNDLKSRFLENPLLQVNVHPVIGNYPEKNGIVSHGSDTWFERKIVEFNEITRNNRLSIQSTRLPYLRFKGCQATSYAASTITPEGYLVRCPEQFGDDQITGNIWEGITNLKVFDSWRLFADYKKCCDCVMFPYCVRALRCSAQDRCYYRSEYLQQTENMVLKKLSSSIT